MAAPGDGRFPDADSDAFRLVDGALQPVTLVHQPALLGQGGLRG